MHASPGEPGFLAAIQKRPSPEPSHPFPKDPQAVDISRDRVVVEVALHDRLEPLARLRHRLVHTRAKLLLDLLQFRSHTFARRLALDGKVPLPVCPADMRETQKVERLGLAFSSPFPALFGIPPELDPARFIWMEFQPKLPQPFLVVFQKTVRFRPVLETEDAIIGLTNDDDVSLRALLAPDLHPEIKDVVQIDIGQQR